jgi:hypothetical protein
VSWTVQVWCNARTSYLSEDGKTPVRFASYEEAKAAADEAEEQDDAEHAFYTCERVA